MKASRTAHAASNETTLAAGRSAVDLARLFRVHRATINRLAGEESFLKHPYKYVCTDTDMNCVETDATVHDDYLSFDASTLEISEWTDKQMTITENASCRTNIIIVDLRPKT